MGGKTVEMFSDSRLVVGQVKGELEAWDTGMQEYLSQVRRIQTKFEFFEFVYPQKWKYPCRLFDHPCHFLGTRFASSNTCWRLVHPNPNKEGLTPGSSNQVRAELDGSYIAIPWKGYIVRGEIKGWESTKKSSLVLDVRGRKFVQTFFFWTISALCISRCIGITSGRTAWRGLQKSHRRKIFISSGHYSRILVARHAKGGTRIC